MSTCAPSARRRPAGSPPAPAAMPRCRPSIPTIWKTNRPAQAELAEAANIATARTSALLCLEANAKECHRSLIAARLVERDGFEVVDL
jgi:hypothetical protein